MTTEQPTEQAAVTATELTDEKINEFFDNGGKFNETTNESTQKESEQVVGEETKALEQASQEPKEEKKVNLGALHEERQRRKDLQAKLSELEKERDQWKANQQPKTQEPKLDDDPIAVLIQKTQQMEQFLNTVAEHGINQTQDQQFWGKVSASEKAFKQDVPDFEDAAKYLAETRIEELKELGYDDAGAGKVLSDEIKWIANKAYQDEVNPAERFYKLAKRRGYKPAQVEAEEAEFVPEPKENLAEAKLKTIKKGQESNKQLPPASRNVKSDLTVETLADMKVDALNGSDFDSAWNKLFGKSA